VLNGGSIEKLKEILGHYSVIGSEELELVEVMHPRRCIQAVPP